MLVKILKRKLLYLILSILLVSPAKSHDWYDPACCSGMDCKPIESCSEIEETADGVKWDVYRFRKDQIKPSQDNKCHVCIHHGIPICIYIQQGS